MTQADLTHLLTTELVRLTDLHANPKYPSVLKPSVEAMISGTTKFLSTLDECPCTQEYLDMVGPLVEGKIKQHAAITHEILGQETGD